MIHSFLFPLNLSLMQHHPTIKKNQLYAIVEGLVKKKLPVIDCAGWEAVVLDDVANEVLRFDDYYIAR
jgi:hypothetical protein